MKTILLISALFIFSISVFAQTYNIGHTQFTFTDPARDNREIPTEVYYPASEAGEDVQVANGTFPVIITGHGFFMGYDAYENIWTEFVPAGYIIALPATEGGMTVSHEDFGLDLAFLVSAVQDEGNDPASVLYTGVDTRTAIMGHSMGGGAAFLAAATEPDIVTVVGLAPAETDPSAINIASDITIPAVIFSGEADGVTPPDEHHIPIYNNLSSNCKTFITIIGGAHCYFANPNLACDFGESSSSTGISIEREEQHQILFDFAGLWFDYILKGNGSAFDIFNDSLNTSARVSFMQECETTLLDDNYSDNDDVLIYPNPSAGIVYFEFQNAGSDQLIIEISDINSRNVYVQYMNTGTAGEIDLSDLPKGVYIINIINHDSGIIKRKKIIKY